MFYLEVFILELSTIDALSACKRCQAGPQKKPELLYTLTIAVGEVAALKERKEKVDLMDGAVILTLD